MLNAYENTLHSDIDSNLPHVALNSQHRWLNKATKKPDDSLCTPLLLSSTAILNNASLQAK